jgi:hypothetical protein
MRLFQVKSGTDRRHFWRAGPCFEGRRAHNCSLRGGRWQQPPLVEIGTINEECGLVDGGHCQSPFVCGDRTNDPSLYSSAGPSETMGTRAKDASGKLAPDHHVVGCDRHEPEPKHIAARLRHAPDLRPSNPHNRQCEISLAARHSVCASPSVASRSEGTQKTRSSETTSPQKRRSQKKRLPVTRDACPLVGGHFGARNRSVDLQRGYDAILQSFNRR